MVIKWAGESPCHSSATQEGVATERLVTLLDNVDNALPALVVDRVTVVGGNTSRAASGDDTRAVCRNAHRCPRRNGQLGLTPLVLEHGGEAGRKAS